MSTEDGAISQKALDSILARALAVPPESEPKPLFGIQRILCHRATVSDLPAGASTRVSVYDAIRRTHAALGNLVSTRRVGPFVVRFVYSREGDSKVWRIIETDTRNKRVVLLTYGSEGDRAREAAAQYATDATEVDLTSDFNPEAYFFWRAPAVENPRTRRFLIVSVVDLRRNVGKSELTLVTNWQKTPSASYRGPWQRSE
jgi:hypothetical protein